MLARRHSLTRDSRSPNRRGTFAPAAIVALVVVVSGVALVLDKLWLDAAQLELNTAVEAAALSSGRALASDDLLRVRSNSQLRLEQARFAATELAAKNRIGGEPVQLDPSPDGSIRFGKLIFNPELQETVFIETAENPTSVVVMAERSYSQSNPVALFWQGIAGITHGNVFARTEATVDNHVVALRALNGIPIPVLPLAILKQPLNEQQQYELRQQQRYRRNDEQPLEDWETQIEQRSGRDLLALDPTSHRVMETADGLSEITLRTMGRDADPSNVNAYFFLLDPQTTQSEFYQHVQRGWGQSDFKSSITPELRLDRGALAFQTLDVTGGDFERFLLPHVGECRIVFLYEQCESGKLKCSGVVAGRIMTVKNSDNGGVQMVFQPGVLTTRTAVLVNEGQTTVAAPAPANKYVFKLQLTF